MKKTLRVFTVTVCLYMVTSLVPAFSQQESRWVSNGPYGGSILCLAIDPQSPQTVYAGTESGGVFKSTNGGGSWIPVNTGLENSFVYALAIDPKNAGTVYAGIAWSYSAETGGGSV